MNSLILLAGGIGTRTGLDIPKQFITIDGKTLLEICYKQFVDSKLFDSVVVVCDESYRPLVTDVCKKFKLPFCIANAGEQRANSVLNGLLMCSMSSSYVAIHDSARANIKTSLIKEVYECCVTQDCGAIPGYVGSDSIKLVNNNQTIEKTLDRNLVFKVQTPQIFPYPKILEAYQYGFSNDYNGTDCSSYYEQLYTVKIVNGDPTNIKVTYASDLVDLEDLLKS